MTPLASPSSPKPLHGFERIHRHFDKLADSWVVQILPGEYYVTPHDEIISTVLGSCIATCIRDTRSGLGGMNHFMLPQEPGRDKKGEAMRYGCFAIERLVNELLKNGAKRGYLEVKIFGGGHVLPGAAGDIGRANIEFVRTYCRDEGLAVRAEDVGDRCARRLRYQPATGRAMVKHLPMSEARSVAAQEAEHARGLRKAPVAGEVELF